LTINSCIICEAVWWQLTFGSVTEPAVIVWMWRTSFARLWGGVTARWRENLHQKAEWNHVCRDLRKNCFWRTQQACRVSPVKVNMHDFETIT
jgi:hypothetical protein